MSSYVYARGREAIRATLTQRDGSVDPFGAVVFGKLYEDLLHYYFSSQRTTAGSAHTWRDAGEAWVIASPSGRKIRQDYLLESRQRRGHGPKRGHLVCFEAKSWPGYRDYATLTAKNVDAFLDDADRFVSYVRRPASSWWVRFPDSNLVKLKPDAFGFLVFDYAHSDHARIVAAMRKRHQKLSHVESIVDRLSMVLFNGGVKDEAARVNLRRFRRTTNRLCSLFLTGE